MPLHRKRATRQKRISRPITFLSVPHTKPPSASGLLLFFDGLTKLPLIMLRIKKILISLSRSKKIGILFLLLGILLISAPHITNLFINVSMNEAPIRADTTFTMPSEDDKQPIRIIIPSLNIDIPVVSSKLHNGYWEVSEYTASFGLGSAPPGTVGNTVIFAHAREGLFLPLKHIAIGRDIYVLTRHHWHRYKVEEIREVFPTDVYVVNKTQDNRLTLFTCSGFLDSKRLVVIAKPNQ